MAHELQLTERNFSQNLHQLGRRHRILKKRVFLRFVDQKICASFVVVPFQLQI